MPVSKVGRRGKVTLPKKIRQELKIREGDQVAFVHRGDEVVLRPLNQTLLEFRGSVPVSNPQDFAEIRERVRKTHARSDAEKKST